MNKRDLYILTLSLSLVGYVWLSWNLIENINQRDVPSPCLVKQVVGIPCPSCGTTTAMTALIHGDILSSLLLNPFGLIIMAALFIFPGWIVLDILRTDNSFFRFYGWIEIFFDEQRWISIPAVFLVVINWIWNISKGL